MTFSILNNSTEVDLICENGYLKSTANNELSVLKPICEALNKTVEDYWTYQYWPYSCTLILFVFFILSEILDIFSGGFKAYVSDLTNWIQIIIIGNTILFFIESEVNIEVALHSAAWMVFLVWINSTTLLLYWQTIAGATKIQILANPGKPLQILDANCTTFDFIEKLLQHLNLRFDQPCKK